ncbi:protein PTST homolog 2, chloroplastic-like [Salvia splendens]|nr:protein PTST homolog 2, chloroplastic-like [Salvia splendens]
MLSLTAHAQIPTSNHCVACFNSRLAPAFIFVWNPKKFLNFSFQLNEERRAALKSGTNLDRSWCCGSHQGDGDVELEAEIMDFMAKSEKPSMFPTKEELVRAIKERGGWYSLGWDDQNAEETTDFDIAEFHSRIESCKQTASSSFVDEELPGSSLLETSHSDFFLSSSFFFL